MLENHVNLVAVVPDRVERDHTGAARTIGAPGFSGC